MNLQTISNASHDQQFFSGSRTASDSIPQHTMSQAGKLGNGFKRPPPLQLSELPEAQEEAFEGPPCSASTRHHGSGFSTPALLQLVLDPAVPSVASTVAPSPSARGLCSPAQRCLFAGLKPGEEQHPGSSSSVGRGVTPDVVDRVAVDRWLHGMEARQAPCTRSSEDAAEADVPPPAFVVLQLLG
jgi:hypothetical protein